MRITVDTLLAHQFFKVKFERLQEDNCSAIHRSEGNGGEANI